MNIHLKLSHRFLALVFLFVSIMVAVLYLMVDAKNEPINFGKQELKGNVYQRPLEKILHGIARHRVSLQRGISLAPSTTQVLEIQKSVDVAIVELEKADAAVGVDLQFTDQGLRMRKREHVNLVTFKSEWADLKARMNSLKNPVEIDSLHTHLIGDIRVMITHSGDTSNLILDPDLDSYYLMDVTLLALPQAQDRIQNVIVALEPLLRSTEISHGDRVRASVFAAMMGEADLERIKADHSTILNEDPNFYGPLESLTTKLAPSHDKFVSAYGEFIDAVQKIAAGQPVPADKFNELGDRALSASFEHWNVAVGELDGLLQKRVDVLQDAKMNTAIMSVLCILLALGGAWLFMRFLISNLRRFVTVLDQTSEQMSGTFSLSEQSATELSEASTEQAASLQETLASIEEISAMVRQNVESADNTKNAVEASQMVSEEGARNVDEMMRSIGDIKDTNDEILSQMESSNKEFGEIIKIISEIGSKTNVINEIVFQTKLLSFNASVEAARAGEHGKGFAVVAEEVGKLAQMSGNAAKEITEMLSESIKKVNAIVEHTKNRVDELVDAGKEKISVGESTANRCREALTKITANVRTVAQMISEITHASKEQAQGIQEVNKALTQLDQVTQQNSAVAQQGSAQAEQLNSQAMALSKVVAQLVKFVDGTNSRKSVAPPPESANPVSSGGHKSNKVVAFAQPRNGRRATDPLANGGHTNGIKKAVGGGVPSSDDPNFGEF